MLALRWTEPPTAEPVPAIVAAAEVGDLSQVDRLLSLQSGVNSRDFCQWTPLMKASLNGHEAVVKLLLEKKAQVELSDKGCYTALILALPLLFTPS